MTAPEKRDEIGTRIARLSDIRGELVVARSDLQSKPQALVAAAGAVESDRTRLSLKRRDIPDWPTQADVIKSHAGAEAAPPPPENPCQLTTSEPAVRMNRIGRAPRRPAAP